MPIYLSSTLAVLRVSTSSTSALDVQVSAIDMDITTSDRPPAYSKNTAITTVASDVVVCDAPGTNIKRAIKEATFHNKGGATNVITVEHYDGTVAARKDQVALAPGWSLKYEDGVGWKVTSGAIEIVQNMPNAGVPITDADTIVRLTSDVTNSNAVANTIADVTGLSFPVLANKLYAFNFDIVYTAAATTTGSRWAINGPASPTYLGYRSEYSLTTTTTTRNALIQAYDSPAASNASSAATGNNWASIYGVIQPSADGTVIARFASEVASSAIVAKVNSFVRYRQISP